MPTVFTSYGPNGVLQRLEVGGSGCCTSAQVTFQTWPTRLPQEAAIFKADCLIHTEQTGSTSMQMTTEDGSDTPSYPYRVELLFHDQVSMTNVE